MVRAKGQQREGTQQSSVSPLVVGYSSVHLSSMAFKIGAGCEIKQRQESAAKRGKSRELR